MKIQTTRCRFEQLQEYIIKIRWNNVQQILSCYCGNGEYFYTIIYMARNPINFN